MDEILATTTFFCTVLFYPVMTGPLAAYLFLKVINENNPALIRLFWPILIALHVAAFLWLMRSLGDTPLEPVFFSCLITPVFAIATALGLRVASHRAIPMAAEDSAWRRRLALGTLLIPAMQLATMVIFMVLAPTR